MYFTTVFFQLKKTNKLFQCNNGAFIRKEHTCNGITECGDGSDEESCGNGMICAVLVMSL